MRWWLGVLAAVIVIRTAQAAPITRPLAQSGGWSTVEQVPTPTSPPDSCMIVEVDSAVALRSIGPDVDLMVANAHWDLPPAMRAAMTVTLGGGAERFPVTFTTRNTAAAHIDPSALPGLLDAMSHHVMMRVTLFPGMPVLVPLAGFAGALPAFRRCAGLT
jgi:hypothetical protein